MDDVGNRAPNARRLRPQAILCPPFAACTLLTPDGASEDWWEVARRWLPSVTSSVQNHCSGQQRSGQVSRVPSDLTCRSGHSARRSVLWACRSRVTISFISEQSYKARPTNGRSGQPQKGMEPARKPWDTELAQWGVGAARGDTGNDQPDRPALQKPARSGMAQSGEEDGSPRRRRCTTWSIFFFFCRPGLFFRHARCTVTGAWQLPRPACLCPSLLVTGFQRGAQHLYSVLRAPWTGRVSPSGLDVIRPSLRIYHLQDRADVSGPK